RSMRCGMNSARGLAAGWNTLSLRRVCAEPARPSKTQGVPRAASNRKLLLRHRRPILLQRSLRRLGANRVTIHIRPRHHAGRIGGGRTEAAERADRAEPLLQKSDAVLIENRAGIAFQVRQVGVVLGESLGFRADRGAPIADG